MACTVHRLELPRAAQKARTLCSVSTQASPNSIKPGAESSSSQQSPDEYVLQAQLQPVDLSTSDPPLARKFAWQQLDLVNAGMTKRRARDRLETILEDIHALNRCSAQQDIVASGNQGRQSGPWGTQCRALHTSYML